mmetsp:Transcript_7867/g.14608  ORF Transcript_7867/g.14608 Transcript_7867/m.14608 type:complete len:185 (-) Transcript_7867:22-576(-)|eukprot:CAMPEP_0197525288 /NCGR_PEP_ID=MMETSP1318-20131121/10737_1 /TAXON_ID=552666 /ORGANISM="Partenskyella glossopodia, Strain RCC365" /LENGTH=184 /DNA_ID=CAMNT_0043078497 /DNA_START=46 /DNA_END=600 /DNA_ORIENTATION=+
MTHRTIALSVCASLLLAAALVAPRWGSKSAGVATSLVRPVTSRRQLANTRLAPGFMRTPVVGGLRRVIARNEGLEQIPEPEAPDARTGYTARDSAGQSNIFGRETKAYVGDSVSRNGIYFGGTFLLTAAAAGAFIVPQLTTAEDFSVPKYNTMMEYQKKYAGEMNIQLAQSAPALSPVSSESSE